MHCISDILWQAIALCLARLLEHPNPIRAGLIVQFIIHPYYSLDGTEALYEELAPCTKKD